MTPSLVYRSAAGYELVMRVLYGRHYRARLRVIADQVRPGATVLELCPGPGTLYQRHLRGRVSAYTGVDVNPRFVRRLRGLGASALELDLTRAGPLPKADVVILQASLYHFIPEAEAIIERMLSAAQERVIIAEPIRNISTSGLPLLARVGRRGTNPGTGAPASDPRTGHAERFNERTLDRLMERYRDRTVSVFTIPGSREKVFVLDPRQAEISAPDPRPGRRSGTGAGP